MNEDSKAYYHELVTNQIIPKIKEDNDNELSIEEINSIGTHLGQEIEDLNHQIEDEKDTHSRKKYVKKELKSNNIKRNSMIILSENINIKLRNRFLRIEIAIQKLTMTPHS